MSLKKDKEKILFFRESVFRIAELIFNKPTETFHIRMLEKETEFSTTAVIKAIDELKRFKIVLVEKTNLTTNIKANLESEAYRFYKTVFNLYRLKRYLVIDTLVGHFRQPKAIVLFGSFAKGEDIEESDIDLLIISSNKRTEDIDEYLAECEKEFNRKINLTVLESLENSERQFKNGVANGIVLHGYLKVI